MDLLLRFFKRQSPFEEVRLLVGHASSQIPDVFFRWVSNLPLEDQEMVVAILLEQVLEGQALVDYLPQAACILVGTVTQYPSLFGRQLLNRLEAYMSSADRINTWVSDIETEDESRDLRSSWQFALFLWNLLTAVRSPKAASLYRIFRDNAKDEHFARSIEIAKRAHEGLWCRDKQDGPE